MKKETEERAYLYWLYSTEGIGGKVCAALVRQMGSAKEVWNAGEKAIAQFVSPRKAQIIAHARKRGAPEKLYEAFIKEGMTFLLPEDSLFPEKLKRIPDAPGILYVKGRSAVPAGLCVAIVGARFCSSYGRYMARQFGQALAANGIHVISGMALGVDGIAQLAALEAGGYSAAVLGCGADVCYPPENRALYDRLCEHGTIFSEYAPGTPPKPGLFPPRNRIISGLADAVLVVEARAKSGTLITVDMALEQGRDVFVLPGRATDRLSDGCNLLLKQGAVPALSAADIVEYYFGVGDAEKEKNDAAKTHAADHNRGKLPLSDAEREIIRALDIHLRPAADILEDESLRKSGRSAQELMCALTELALKGLIEQEGNCFARRTA